MLHALSAEKFEFNRFSSQQSPYTPYTPSSLPRNLIVNLKKRRGIKTKTEDDENKKRETRRKRESGCSRAKLIFRSLIFVSGRIEEGSVESLEEDRRVRERMVP